MAHSLATCIQKLAVRAVATGVLTVCLCASSPGYPPPVNHDRYPEHFEPFHYRQVSTDPYTGLSSLPEEAWSITAEDTHETEGPRRAGDESWPIESGPILSAARQPAGWQWQWLPESLFYRSYLAGSNEPRMGTQFHYNRSHGGQVDSTIGGRIGFLRRGNADVHAPQGWQLDVEAGVMLRQDLREGLEMVANDFRFGFPLTYANGPYRMKLTYYHVSAHLGDEFMLRTGTARINYVRDALVWGHAFYLTPDLRIYGEIGFSFNVDDGAEPWELQFGVEYSPAGGSGLWGDPFLAINAHLREEVNFGGSLTLQAGRQWRRLPHGALLRLGLHYHNGKSPQFEFHDEFEHQIGMGLWYDF